MKCPACGKQTEGRDHNKRGLRCTFCWARVPDELPEPPKPRRRRKKRLPTEVELATTLANE